MGTRQTASSQMDGVRGMLDALMHPPPGARPVLDLAGSDFAVGAGGDARVNGTDAAISGGIAPITKTQDPARSLLGAIAKGVLLKQEKERRQVCTCGAASPSDSASDEPMVRTNIGFYPHISLPSVRQAATASAEQGAMEQHRARVAEAQIGEQRERVTAAAGGLSLPGAALDRVLQQLLLRDEERGRQLDQLLQRDEERGRQLRQLTEAWDAMEAQQASLKAGLDGLTHQLEQARHLRRPRARWSNMTGAGLLDRDPSRVEPAAGMAGLVLAQNELPQESPALVLRSAFC